MAILGGKLGGKPMDRSVDVLGIESGDLFLGSSRVCPTLLMFGKMLPRVWNAHKKRTWTGIGSVPECIGFFPYMVYIDLNHRDS
jgi:hypothetical protein